MTKLLKLFGTGQITLPINWRKKFDTTNFIAEETSKGLLIKPLLDIEYIENSPIDFSLNFPTGISSKELAKNLKKANEKLS